MSISNSSRISIKGRASLTNVSGNQTNTTVNGNGNVIHVQTKTAVGEDPMYKEFTYVKKGDIIMGENLGSGTIDWCWLRRRISNGAHKAMDLEYQPLAWTETFHVTLHPDQQTPFTACVYAGKSTRDAERAWEKDFSRFSRNRTREKVQLFGFNKWDVPMLVFHRELIPLAHIISQSRFIWGEISARCLSESITGSGGRETDLWLDTKSGRFIEGPTGPWCDGWSTTSLLLSLPHTMEMFEEDASIRFYSTFATHDFDRQVLTLTTKRRIQKHLDDVFPDGNIHPPYSQTVNEPINWTLEYPYLTALWLERPHHLPLADIGQLRVDTIYSPQLLPLGRIPFCWYHSRPGFPVIMVGEMTRITLEDVPGATREKYAACWDYCSEIWLSQATRIYNALQPISYGLDQLLIFENPFCLGFYTQRDFHPKIFFDLCDGVIEEHPPVYLFLYAPPLTISEYIQWKESGIWRTHFWSFDEDGNSEIPEDECARMDLPHIVPETYDVFMYSWPQHVYNGLEKYQRARGFDPNTSDWAKYLGYPEVEIIGGRENNQLGSASIQEVVDGESTSSFFEAGAGSGISAFGFC